VKEKPRTGGNCSEASSFRRNQRLSPLAGGCDATILAKLDIGIAMRSPQRPLAVGEFDATGTIGRTARSEGQVDRLSSQPPDTAYPMSISSLKAPVLPSAGAF
jgi:hypothetical protein